MLEKVILSLVHSIHEVVCTDTSEKGQKKQHVSSEHLLKSAVFEPYQTFDNVELYPTPLDKAACLWRSLSMNHPFHDGNKRTAWATCRVMLLKSGYEIKEKFDDDEIIADKTVAFLETHAEVPEFKSWLEKISTVITL